MKLVRIEHERCSETDCVTYAWVPDDWSEEQLEDAVGRAQKAYLENYARWKEDKENEPEHHWATWGSKEKFYTAHPDETVAEVDKLWQEALANRAAWEKKYDEGKKRFADFLLPEGVTPFFDHEPTLSAYVSWGHRHGDSLSYNDGSDRLHKKDLPGPVVSQDGAGYVEKDWLGKE